MFLADLHLHSTFSDGKLTIRELVDLYGRAGFGAIAITDHLCETHTLLGVGAHVLNRTLTLKNFSEYLTTIELENERAWRLYKMVVIPGFELTKNFISNHRSAHVLGLGVSRYVSANLDPVDMCRELHEQNALAVAAHPVHTRVMEKQTYHLWNRREELRHHFDAWEVASGQHLFSEVLQSELPVVASSDLHQPWQMSSWKTSFKTHRHREAILDAIRDQDLEPHYYEVPSCWELPTRSTISD